MSYRSGFTGNLLEYNINNVMLVTVIGIAGFAVLLLFKPTANHAPLALWGGAFASFLVYMPTRSLITLLTPCAGPLRTVW